MKPEWIIIAGAAVAAAILVLPPLLRRRRRNRLKTLPLPAEWEEILHRNLRLYRRLPEPLREKLHRSVNVFIGEKNFAGGAGLDVTDEMRVTIAGQACMIVLGWDGICFPGVDSVYVYPSTYVYRSPNGDRDVNIGESWVDGRVVLAWDASVSGTALLQDPQNVIIHEFAHQLDPWNNTRYPMEEPPLMDEMAPLPDWGPVWNREFEALQRGGPGADDVIDEYGATNPAEFFAVATEAFFEKPFQLQRKHKALYEELQQFYGLNPTEWF